MIDPSIILETSRRFYAAHRLADWNDALPAAAFLADDDRAEAVKHGFTAAFAFPPFPWQMATLDRLVDAMARQPAPIPDNQQYVEPFLSDDWSKTANGQLRQRTDDLGGREWGAYLLLYSPNPLAKCWGLTGKQIRAQFEAKDWRGLTVPEYLVLQRLWCEKHGDHRFFEQPEDDGGSHAIWLIDSMDDKKCTVALSSKRGINLQAADIGNRDRKRATIGGRVVLLG